MRTGSPHYYADTSYADTSFGDKPCADASGVDSLLSDKGLTDAPLVEAPKHTKVCLLTIIRWAVYEQAHLKVRSRERTHVKQQLRIWTAKRRCWLSRR